MKAKFVKAVDNGDLISTRIFIANEIMLDPRGTSFQEMKTYAESKFSNLYEVSDGISYSLPESEWNSDFLTQLMKDLDSNFSKERLLFYERVAKFVLREKATKLNREESKENPKQSTNSTSCKKDIDSAATTSKKNLAVGIAVGGVAVTIAGLCLEKIALTSLGIVGIAISGIIFYNGTKK